MSVQTDGQAVNALQEANRIKDGQTFWMRRLAALEPAGRLRLAAEIIESAPAQDRSNPLSRLDVVRLLERVLPKRGRAIEGMLSSARIDQRLRVGELSSSQRTALAAVLRFRSEVVNHRGQASG